MVGYPVRPRPWHEVPFFRESPENPRKPFVSRVFIIFQRALALVWVTMAGIFPYFKKDEPVIFPIQLSVLSSG